MIRWIPFAFIGLLLLIIYGWSWAEVQEPRAVEEYPAVCLQGLCLQANESVEFKQQRLQMSKDLLGLFLVGVLGVGVYLAFRPREPTPDPRGRR